MSLAEIILGDFMAGERVDISEIKLRARRAFEAALSAVPDDGPSTAFIKRIEVLAITPPGKGWDGSWHLGRK